MTLNYDIRREAHAIGEFSATLRFFRGVGVKTYSNVVPLLTDAAKALDLPAPMNVQVFNIGIGNAPALPPPAPGGGFQRFAADGEIAASLWCDQESITFTLREYERWDKVLPSLIKTFSKIAPAYMEEVPAIRMFSLQYINEFKAKPQGFTRTDELFKKNNAWIAPFSFGSEQPWHCHVGQFIPSDGPYRYLINLNCDVMPKAFAPDNLIKNYVKVLILAACHYDLPEKGPLIAKVEDLPSLIEDNLNRAHSMEKKLLGEVISDEYLAIMGEGANEH